MTLDKYLKKVYNERTELSSIGANQVELVGTKDGAGNRIGINAQGSVGGQDIGQLFQAFKVGLQKKNIEASYDVLKKQFESWLQGNHPDVLNEVNKAGGLDKLMGQDKIPDIVVSDAGKGSRDIKVTPDA